MANTMTLTQTLVSRGWTEQDAQYPDAAFIGRDYSLKPNRFLSREDFDRLRVKLADLLPTGCTLRDGDMTATVTRDERGIPSIVLVDGRVAERLSTSAAVSLFFRHFGHVTVTA